MKYKYVITRKVIAITESLNNNNINDDIKNIFYSYMFDEQLSKNLILPDGKALTLDYELFHSIESVFFPFKDNLLKKIYECIENNDDSNTDIILSGGCSNFQNLSSKFQSYGQQIFPANFQYKLMTPTTDNYLGEATWLGASILASIPNCFSSPYISQEDINEFGIAPCVVRKMMDC